MRIAVLDDDLLLLEQIKGTLECHQHVCHTFADGTSLLQALRQETFDLLLVDWHLPDMEGTDVVQTVRNTHGMLSPILFITRRSDERDVVEALSRGADDFMSKPLRMGELVARATALLRRAYPQSMGARLGFGAYRFDAEQRTLQLHGEAIGLKHREYELALFLFRNAGRLLSPPAGGGGGRCRRHPFAVPGHPHVPAGQQAEVYGGQRLHDHGGVWGGIPAGCGAAAAAAWGWGAQH